MSYEFFEKNGLGITTTVYDFLKRKKITAVQMAQETGLSQALISKLKLNQCVLTDRAKSKLEETYPNVIFTSDGLDVNWVWKSKYYQSLEVIRQQRLQIQKLEEKLKVSRKARNALRVLAEELL